MTPEEGHCHQTPEPASGSLSRGTSPWTGPQLGAPAQPHLPQWTGPQRTGPQRSSWACPGSQPAAGALAGDPASKSAPHSPGGAESPRTELPPVGLRAPGGTYGTGGLFPDPRGEVQLNPASQTWTGSLGGHRGLGNTGSREGGSQETGLPCPQGPGSPHKVTRRVRTESCAQARRPSRAHTVSWASPLCLPLPSWLHRLKGGSQS